ncbi:MAG TPA: bifunctional oligoribonuclease/PAP phosphatase NrnA [Clostridiales bacterium]|nr:bifunctional oligoribonuclease/PAP phosphatase NrnA [Clostridiales bacterium]
MTIKDVHLYLRQSERIALIAHIQPDGDTIGSCLALADILKAEGKSVDLYCQDNVPEALKFLQDSDQFLHCTGNEDAYDLAIAVDCSDKERMGTCSSVFDAGRHSINIDHHISNTMYAELNLVDTNAAATGEIIYALAKSLNKQISRNAAEALYAAISTDTGSFCFSSTTSRSYRIAADLLDCGIDAERITTLLYKSNRIERIRLLGRALNSLSLYENGKVALMIITREDLSASGALDSETENLVNYAKDIMGVELGILLKEAADGSIKASFRSKGNIDVSILAGRFNGGGHKAASGASIKMEMGKVKESILAAVHEMLKECR